RLRLRVELGEHVSRVVVQPRGLLVVPLGREGDRAADLEDHLGYGFLEEAEEVVELLEVRREASRRRIPDMNMKDRGAVVVAIHRRLHLLIPRDRDVRRVSWQ